MACKLQSLFKMITTLFKICRVQIVKFFTLLRSRSRLVTLTLLVVFILHLHFRVMPRAMGGYNDKCYASKRDLAEMEFLLTRFTDALNKDGVTYWLDYGTLLGVWKTGQIFDYDVDVDIGRLYKDASSDGRIISKLQRYLEPLNITVNQFQAKYRSKTIDLFRWRVINNSKGEQVLRKWYPFVERWGFVESIVLYFFPQDIPYDVLFPTRELTVYNTTMSVPNRSFDLLKLRYPLTWFTTFPYKWKCWL